MEAQTLKKVEIPKEVVVKVDSKSISVKGPKGELIRDFDNPKYNKSLSIAAGDGELEIKSGDKKILRAIAGTIEAHVRNMIQGVTVGYEYRMKIVYSHFPITVSQKEDEIHVKNFLGEKGARIAHVAKGCSVKIDKEEIVLTGIDIEAVGRTVQRIEQACRLSGRDRRVFQDGIFLVTRALQNGKSL